MMIAKALLSESDFVDVFSLLLELHEEGGFAPLQIEKAMADCYAVMQQDMTWLARDEKGEPIGVLGLIEDQFWYSDLTFLLSKWFYVRPEQRFGRVGVKLCLAARDEADRRGQMAFILTNNRSRKPKRGWATLVAEQAGYFPAGYMLKLGGREHGQRDRDQAADG